MVWDVAIVGARVAGSVCASLLGDRGHSVLLVDAARFPSDTISTHFFRGAGLGSVMDGLGILERVLALGAPPLDRQYVFHGDDPNPAVEEAQDPGFLGSCLSVRRLALDAVLLERARTAGVVVWEGTPARGLVRDATGRVVGLTVQRAGATEEVQARVVIGADGRGSAVARWVNAPTVRRSTAARAMYLRYMRGYEGPSGSWNGPEFSFLGDELVYAFPSDGRITCVAISINLTQFDAFRARPEAMFNQRIAAHVGVGPRFAVAGPASRILGSGPKPGSTEHLRLTA